MVASRGDRVRLPHNRPETDSTREGPVDSSPAAADPEAAAADRGTAALLLVLVVVEHGERLLVMFALERFGRFGSERPVGVGDVPAEPVVLDRGGHALPAVAVGPAWRSGSEHVVEVGGWVGGEVGGTGAAVVAQLGVDVP